MFAINKNKCQVFLLHNSTTIHFLPSVRTNLLLFLLLTTLVSGCCKECPPDVEGIPLWHDTQLSIQKTSAAEIGRVDVFVYEDDYSGRLDCYQSFLEKEENDIYDISSCKGDKTMVVLCNSRADEYLWKDICSVSQIGNLAFNLEDEDADHPIMYSITEIRAGVPASTNPRPIMSEILLRSISCDFSGESYQGLPMTDVKAYLTNVNAEWRLSDNQGNKPRRIINCGRLFPEDISRFKNKEMIVGDIAERIGAQTLMPDKCFRCYPNCSEGESIGTPYTRLVIEGKIGGDTYYYPIEINRDGDGNGIERNCRYVFDIKITQTGLTDPEGSLDQKQIKTRMNIVKWEEKEWYDIVY